MCSFPMTGYLVLVAPLVCVQAVQQPTTKHRYIGACMIMVHKSLKLGRHLQGCDENKRAVT